MGQFGIGQSVRRTEDVRFVTGRGRYTDDIDLPRLAHAIFLRSPHPHAVIRAIDPAEALASPGVLAVYTGADLEADGIGGIRCPLPLKGKGGRPVVAPPRPPLALGKVRQAGEAVAMVVALTLDAARDAAELVQIDYEELPAVADGEAALAAGAPQIWDEAPGNLCLDWENGERAAVEKAFAGAARIVELDLVNNRIVVNSMEPRNAVGEYDARTGRYTLHTTTQGSHKVQQALAEDVLKVPHSQVRVVTNDVGGGFGMKICLYPEQAMVVWAARKLGRPVKWNSDRTEAFLTDTQGRDHLTRARMAVDGNGRFLALHVATVANIGGHLSPFGPFVPTAAGTGILTGVYDIPACLHEVKVVFTNTTSVDAYRGAGRPEAIYLVERLADVVAHDLGLDPAEVRRRNFIRTDQFPYTNPLGLTYDSGEFDRLLGAALEAADHGGFEARRREARARGRLRGIGMSAYIEVCARGLDERAELRFDQDGGLTLLIGTQSNGQSHETTYAQLVEERLGIPFERIRVVQGDTDAIPFGRGTGGSRSLPVGGMAVNRASDKVIAKAKTIAAHLLEAAEADLEFRAGRFAIAGTDRGIDILEVVKTAFQPAKLPKGLEPGLDEIAHYMPEAPTYPNGVHLCEVEVDGETGTVEVVNYVVVDDMGKIVNPMVVEGQIQGGIAQGVGQALWENCVYDAESAQLVTGSFMDYCMPRADGVPFASITFDQTIPCKTNELGVKGCGEAGAIGAAPAVVNAVADALGLRHVDMPVTPEAAWRALSDGAA